jgi:glycosyltransferase involved in cell wall biosynthesis
MNTNGTLPSDVLVSICCTAYNLERFIGEAIESFLTQKTSFKYEIIIGEDCSSDSTRKIIGDYCIKYPGLIEMIMSDTNVGTIQNYTRVLAKARGKYIAICDGDDYWTDSLKLQKQVDFLEANKEYVICCHYSSVINENGERTDQIKELTPLSYSFHDVLIGKRTHTRNSTMMIRSSPEFKEVTKQNWMFGCYAQDRFLKLYATSVSGKKIYVLPELMACYRTHPAGASKAGYKVVGPKLRNDFNLMITHFEYSNNIRRELLAVYLKRFFAYDLKKFKINNAISTLKMLVLPS